MEKKAILVFDAAQRSALAATRALGKRKDILVYTADYHENALAGCSRYSEQYLRCPNPSENSLAFIKWVSNTVTQYHIDVLFPLTEVTSRTLLEHQASLPACKLPFAPLHKVLALSNKSELTNLAESLGVPVPASQFCESAADIQWQAVKFPCVLKPALSKVMVDNAWLATQVHIVSSEEEMREVLTQQPYFDGHAFMVQQYIGGQGAGVFCYYQQGEAKAFFAHKRLREKPPSGGVSVLSESVAVDPTMKLYAERLLNSVGWHGVAMVEFKIDEDGTPYLMEINTRLWGSLQLAIDAGVNFPALLVDGEYQPVNTPPPFTTGVQLRWLLGDVDNLYIQLKSGALTFGDKCQHILRFLTPKFAKRRHEINRMDDMNPFWYELKHYFK
ncbi:ATP-grasp domain-containing protein [Alteromonas pelagimontana]|uniref:ATP-grasp domain-containing protein n=1 Tax=Alteromonas pelagimontana TaxID=1858656 RepID=A0A6M4MFX8_9ALTE|nr:ATP-grasp domain-containing protein [Alteromonas pelagimontana]QJR81983.1 ATP-grasp domain-containing protein [Alteromonas pelagimontana]